MSASIFEVQSSFSIEDNATGVLREIAEQFATVGSAADEAAEQLRSLSRVRFDALARSADRAAASIGAMAEAASGVGNAAQTAAASTEAAATANERFAESAQAAAAAQVELTEALQRQIVIPPPVYYGEPEPPTRAADGTRGYLGRDPLTVDTWAYETPSDRPMLSYDEAGTPYAARPGAFPYAGEQLLLGRSSQYGPYGAPKEPLIGFAGDPGMHNPYNRPGTEGPTIPMGGPGAAPDDGIGIPARPIDARAVSVHSGSYPQDLK